MNSNKGNALCGLIGLYAVLICLIPTGVYAQNKKDKTYLLFSGYRCDYLKNNGGFSDTVTGHATEFSCQKPAVGIALYAGKDLGDNPPEKIADFFTQELRKRGVQSKTFIKYDHEYGTSMAFYINGDSWNRVALSARESVKKIDGIAAEAKLVYFTNGQIKEWPKSKK